MALTARDTRAAHAFFIVLTVLPLDQVEGLIMERPAPTSARLSYRRVHQSTLGSFHRLVQDEHIRAYLLDGESLPQSWTRDAIAASDALFEELGVGLWLLFEAEAPQPIGFCGYHRFGGEDAPPQLLYAFERVATQKGYATEATLALVECVVSNPAFDEIIASVDAPNVSSVRVLEKAGFSIVSESEGSFGSMLNFARRVTGAG